MTTNPYPKYKIDEATGLELPGNDYEKWQEGFTAGWQACVSHTNDDLKLIDQSLERLAMVLHDWVRALKVTRRECE